MQFYCIVLIWISVINTGSVNQIPSIHRVALDSYRKLERVKSRPQAFPLSDYQQGHVGNDIEKQEEDFEQPEERVDDHIEGFSGNGKPFALRAIH